MAAAQWLALALLTVVFSAGLELARMPAAILIASMIAAIVVGVRGGTIAFPRLGFSAGQAIIGILVASSLTPALFSAFAENWAAYTLAVLSTLAASSFLGWLISRWGILPGTTGVWGSAPGAASAMVLMAGAFGADQRLVAFMQYLRVILVSFCAALVARQFGEGGGAQAEAVSWFPAIDLPVFSLTIAVTLCGAVLGWLLRLPSPFFVGVFVLGTVLHLGFDVDFQLPEWLLALGYVAIGWTIGLKFRSETLRAVARSVPHVVLSILALMAFCGIIAWLLVVELDVDPLTAYLATSPGGMDSVAIIAAASGDVDITFVMTMQAMRFLFVLLIGPPLARVVAGWVKV